MLLSGTGDGVYRVPPRDGAGGAERVLDCGRVVELAARDGAVLAATRTGLFRSTDRGETWTDLGVPAAEVWAVHPADGTLYAGCYPAALYGSADDGTSWTAVDGLDAAPGRERWYCPGDDDHGRVRTVRTVPGRPGRLLLGVEVGGLYASDDGGASWTAHSGPVADDVHHVNVLGPDTYLVCCGALDRHRKHGPAGLYRTDDGGESWRHLDLGEHAYVRESLVHDGVVYVSGSQTTPGDWDGEDGARAALLESVDDGASFEPVPYPGEPREVVLSWAVDGGTVYGGTGTRAYEEGRLVRREADGWADAGRLPADVYSLASV